MRHLSTMHEEHSHNAMYWGDRGDWYIAYAIHRESPAIDRSNFSCLKSALEKWFNDDVFIERSNHCLVGWIDYLVINPHNKKLIRATINAKKKIDIYPVLNEDHLSNLEYDEFWEYATGELKHFDNWEDVLQGKINECNDSLSIEHGGGVNVVELAREELESIEDNQ